MFSTLSDFTRFQFFFGFCNLGKCTTYSWVHISLAKFFLLKIYCQSLIFSLFFTFFNVSSPKNSFIPISTYELVDLRLSCPPIISKKFRDCFWRNWDDWRNIPKSRFFDRQFMNDWNGIFRNWGGFWALNMCPLLFYHFLCPSKPIKIIGIQALIRLRYFCSYIGKYCTIQCNISLVFQLLLS